MKKIKKTLILGVLSLAALVGVGVFLYNALDSKNSLSISEMRWIDDNLSNVISINIPNDLPIFGQSGKGVFFDFVNYLTDETGLNLNNNTVPYSSECGEYGFCVNTEYDKDKLLLFKDHFIVVSKNTGVINDVKSILDSDIGVLNTDLELVAKYYGVSEDKFKKFDNYDSITSSLSNGELTYAFVSETEYKENLIGDNSNVLAHVSDLKKYYYFNLGDNSILNSILTKEFNTFMKNDYEESYNVNNYSLFVTTLDITEADEVSLTNKVYKYGFTENRPYEILDGGEYGGIVAQYLSSFSEFSGVEFSFKKYKNSTDLAEAAINGKIDLYYNYFNILTNYIDCGALYPVNYYVIAENTNDLSLSNIKGLNGETVYVLEKSYLSDMLSGIDGVEIKTYANTKELNRVLKNGDTIIIDKNTYDYYANDIDSNYSVRYEGVFDANQYTFRYKNSNDTFYKLFSIYTKTIDPVDMVRTGITTYNRVSKKGSIIGTVAIYILIFVVVFVLFAFTTIKRKRTIKLDTKVKKEDKLKYVDLLTSLKNRNYFNDKLNVWNKNRIFPQACLVMDINRVKELNDSFGHEEGDKQILGVSNILIRTQLDNTEIIRTDGNEFMVYLIGYSEKQVTTYMKKLMKEFKKLPYDFGVAMGFSMIEDNTKLVEDAFNDASIQMRENKAMNEEENEKKD